MVFHNSSNIFSIQLVSYRSVSNLYRVLSFGLLDDVTDSETEIRIMVNFIYKSNTTYDGDGKAVGKEARCNIS